MPFAADYLGHRVWIPELRESVGSGLESYGVELGEPWERVERIARAPGNETLRSLLLLPSRSDRWALEEFFRSLRGAAGYFWLVVPEPAFRVAEAAIMGQSSLEIEDNLDLFGFLGRKKHVWLPDPIGAAVEVGEADGGGPDVVSLSVFPSLPAALPAGYEPWPLLFGRLGSDALELAATGAIFQDGAGEVHEVVRASLTFIESQGFTPTSF